MIYLDDNGVTIKAKSGAKGAKAGEIYELNGEKYYVAIDQYDLGRLVKSDSYWSDRYPKLPSNFPLNRVVTSKVTTMNGLFWTYGTPAYQPGAPLSFTNRKYDNDFNEDISSWDTGRVKSMSEMFRGCESFNQPIGHWNTKNVTAMLSMFHGAKAFNQPIGNWNTSRLNNISNMFENAESFNQPIEDWDISRIDNMLNTFKGAVSFNQPLNKWNPGSCSVEINGKPKGARMFSLFEDAKSFNQDLSNWKLSGSLLCLFKGATSFNQPLDSWDVSGVSSMKSLFEGATSFNQNISNWDTSSVGSTENMFYGASSFNQPIGNWDVSSVRNMKNMFRQASSFNKDVSKWDVSNVKQMTGLFQDASSFNQDISNWKLDSSIKKSRTMFQNATSFNEENFNPFNNSEINKIEKPKKIDTGIELSSEDKKAISKIKKFLITRDYEKIDIGLELLISLNNLELFETLLYGCKISTSLTEKKTWSNDPGGKEYYQLINNKFFTGSEPAQPYLDYALIKIIANAPQEAKIDDSLLLKNIFSPNTGKFSFLVFGNLELRDFLLESIDKFTSLTSVEVSLNSSKGHNYEKLFANNNITELNVSGDLGNLKWLKNFSQLKILYFDDEADNLDAYKNFKYLENLEELTFSSSKFEHLDFLAECKKIKKLDLSISYDSDYSEDEVKLENLDFLNKLNELEDLNISGLDHYEFEDFNMDGLSSCKKIKKLTLSISEETATNLSLLKNYESLEILNLIGFSNFQVSGKISDIEGLKGLSNLKSLSIDDFKFYGLDNGNLMTELNTSINQSSANNAEQIRVSERHLVDTGNVNHYNGLPFNGIVFYKVNGILFYEYEMVNGLRDGVYREFYTKEELRGEIKLEEKFNKGERVEVITFYNDDGINIIEGKNCIIGPMLSVDEEGLNYYDENLFTGFCFSRTAAKSSASLLSPSIDEATSLEKMEWGKRNMVYFLLKIIDGKITKDISIATSYVSLHTMGHERNYRVDEDKFFKVSVINTNNIEREKLSNFYVTLNTSEDDLDTAGNSIKLLNGESIVVTGVFENHSRDKLKKIIESNGGKPSSSVSKNTSFILAGSKMGPKKKLKAKELNINIIGEEEFIEKYTSVSQNQQQTGASMPDSTGIPLWNVIADDVEKTNNVVLPRPKLSSDDRKAFSEIKKLLKTRDYDKIDKGVELMVSLNNLELFETLLGGCKISKKDNELKNKFFIGSGPAQPYLDYALFSIIAHAPQEAKIDDSLLHKNISSLSMNLFFSRRPYGSERSPFPPINKFSSLSSLKIDFNYFNIENIEDVFINNNIIELDIEYMNGSFKWLKNFNQLKSLKYNFGYDETSNLDSFGHLVNLEELHLTNYLLYNQGSDNIDFLRKCKKIKKLHLVISSYRTDIKLKNIDAIKNFSELEELSIYGFDSKLNLDALLSCKKIKRLFLSVNDGVRYNGEKINLKSLKNCNLLETLDLSGFHSVDICGKISDINGLKGLSNLKSLSINEEDNGVSVNISGLDNEVFINQ